MKFIYFGLILAYWHKIDTAKVNKRNPKAVSSSTKLVVDEQLNDILVYHNFYSSLTLTLYSFVFVITQ